jgi:hypothetical protein
MPDLAKRPFFRDHSRLIPVGGAKGAYFKLIQPAISKIVQRSTAFRICTLRDHGSPPQYDFLDRCLFIPQRQSWRNTYNSVREGSGRNVPWTVVAKTTGFPGEDYGVFRIAASGTKTL